MIREMVLSFRGDASGFKGNRFELPGDRFEFPGDGGAVGARVRGELGAVRVVWSRVRS